MIVDLYDCENITVHEYTSVLCDSHICEFMLICGKWSFSILLLPNICNVIGGQKLTLVLVSSPELHMTQLTLLL